MLERKDAIGVKGCWLVNSGLSGLGVDDPMGFKMDDTDLKAGVFLKQFCLFCYFAQQKRTDTLAINNIAKLILS